MSYHLPSKKTRVRRTRYLTSWQSQWNIPSVLTPVAVPTTLRGEKRGASTLVPLGRYGLFASS